MPDIRVERAHLTLDEGEISYREADLAGHLNNASGNERPTSSTSHGDSPLADDYQLSQAVSLLKGLNIARDRVQ